MRSSSAVYVHYSAYLVAVEDWIVTAFCAIEQQYS